MKKFISFIIINCFCFLNFSSAFAVEYVQDELIKYLNPDLKIKIQEPKIVEDSLIKYLDPNLKIEKITPKNNETSYKIKIKEALTTKNKKLKEGDYIDFILIEDTSIDKKGTIIKARIENISQNNSYGVPASISISNFKINNNLIEGAIEKTGANRAIWLYPTTYFLSLFFGIGVLLIPIRGGHAKLKPNEIYIIGG